MKGYGKYYMVEVHEHLLENVEIVYSRIHCEMLDAP
jgi:hypothetical protein